MEKESKIKNRGFRGLQPGCPLWLLLAIFPFGETFLFSSNGSYICLLKQNNMINQNIKRKLEILVRLKTLEEALISIHEQMWIKWVLLINESSEEKKKYLEPLKEKTNSMRKEFEDLKAEWQSIELFEELGLEVCLN